MMLRKRFANFRALGFAFIKEEIPYSRKGGSQVAFSALHSLTDWVNVNKETLL